MQHDVEAKLDAVLHSVRSRLAGHPREVVQTDLEAGLAAAGVTLSDASIVPLAVGISALPRGRGRVGVAAHRGGMATTTYLIHRWALAGADPCRLHYLSTEQDWELLRWLARTAGPQGPARMQWFAEGALESMRYLSRRAVEHLRARWSEEMMGQPYPDVPTAIDSVRDLPWEKLAGVRPIFVIDQPPRAIEREQLKNASRAREPAPDMDLFPAAMPAVIERLLRRSDLLSYSRWELKAEQWPTR